MSADRRVAIVTGAGSGIGRASALALLHAGYAVALAGRRLEPLEDTAAAAKPAPGESLVVRTDVSDPVSVKLLFSRVRDAFGRLDVLFNNAGVFPPQTPIEDVSLQDWNTALQANLTGVFLCTQEAFRMMKDQRPRGGRIINNGSLSAHTPRPNSLPYTATKHAITGLTKCASLEGRKYDIACSQIDVGNAETAMMTGVRQGALQASGITVPEPVMDVEHVARAVLYMAGLPLDANVQFMTLMATNMPFVGRG